MNRTTVGDIIGSTRYPTANAIWTAAAILGLLVVATGHTLLGVFLLVVVGLTIVLLAYPSLFLGITLGVYGSVQFLLQESFEVGIGSVSLSASKLFVAAVTSSLVLRALLGLRTLSRSDFAPSSVLWAAAFLAWSCLSTLHQYNGAEAVASLARLGACVAAMWYAYIFVRTPRDLLWICLGSSIAVAISSAVALHAYAQGDSLDAVRVGAFRTTGGFGGAVATGTVAFFGVCLAMAALASHYFEKRWRPVFYATMAVGSVGILMTFTRTAIVGMIVFGFLYLAWSHRARLRAASIWRRVAILSLFVGIFFVVLSFLSEDAVEARLSDIPGVGGGPALASQAGSGRGLLWAVVVDSIMRSTPREWILGQGVSSVPAVMQRSTGLLLGAHNSYLEVLHDSGIVGLFFYLGFATTLLRDFRSAANSAAPSLGAFLMTWHHYLVAYFLSTVLFNGYVYMIGPTWFSMILAGALLGVARAHSWRPRGPLVPVSQTKPA